MNINSIPHPPEPESEIYALNPTLLIGAQETSNWILITERIPFGLKDPPPVVASPATAAAAPAAAAVNNWIPLDWM